MFDNVFETVNSGFVQALYEDFLRDPKSVSAEWRALFENGLKGETPTQGGQPTSESTPSQRITSAVAVPSGTLTPLGGPALRLLRKKNQSGVKAPHSITVGRPILALRTVEINRNLASPVAASM